MVKKHWSVNNGKTWQRSGSKIFLQPKEYTVKFSDVYGLETPNDIKTTIVENQNVIINVEYKTQSLKFTALQNNSSVMLSSTATVSQHFIYYKRKNEDWMKYQLGTAIALSKDDYVFFKNESDSLNVSGRAGYRFSGTGNIKVSGNIQSMLNYSKTTSSNCFNKLFRGFSGLTDASELLLPATELASFCYQGLFYQCEDLIFPPKKIPAIVANQQSLEYMFAYCPNLICMPDISDIMQNGAFCADDMFAYCTSLTKTNKLFFIDKYMFRGCSNLSQIQVGFIEWEDEEFDSLEWVANVAPTGKFICPPQLDTTKRGVSYIPEGWEIQFSEYAPKGRDINMKSLTGKVVIDTPMNIGGLSNDQITIE